MLSPTVQTVIGTRAPTVTLNVTPGSPTNTPDYTPAAANPSFSATLPPSTLVQETTDAAVPTTTPHPIWPYTINGLRQANFPGGTIQFSQEPDQGDGISRYFISYPSPGLLGSVPGSPTVRGLMYAPEGDGPFPTIIMLHGYFDRSLYWSGAGTWQEAEYLAQRGYLVLVPDFRGWGQSESGLSLFHSGLVADTINLVSSLATLPIADPGRVGLWGHSMGGGIATKVLATDPRIRATVLYAPNSADDADLINRWGPGCLTGQSEAAGDKCNPAEIIPPGTPAALIDAYLSAAADPILLQQIAPIYHLESIKSSVQIHVGTADGQALVETPPDWSEKLFQALQVAGKEVTLFSYENQGHFFAGPSWTLFMERAAHFYDSELLRTSPQQ